MTDRSIMIKLADSEYELILTTRAMKAILTKYKSLEHLGEIFAAAEKKGIDTVLDDFIWLVVLLANQSIMLHNLKAKTSKDEIKLLTEEYFELITSPVDFIECAGKIGLAINLGMNRTIESEETEKN